MRRGAPRALLALTLTVSCAGVRVVPLSSADQDRRADGVRYYESSPYLLVEADHEGGVHTELVHLPDPTRKRSIEPYALFASVKLRLTFRDGVLTSATTGGESSATTAALITAIGDLLAGQPALLGGSDPGRGGPLPPPQLFKIVIEPDGSLHLRGGETSGELRFGPAGTP